MRGKNSKGWRAAVIVLSVLLLLVAVIAIWQYVVSRETSPEPTPAPDTSNTGNNTDNGNTTPNPPDNGGTTPDPGDNKPIIDPARVSTVDIQPMNLTVSYIKGVPGFEFNVLRTQGDTQYVQFSAPELVGTKCSDDQGAFASIVKNPTSSDASTLETTTIVGDVTYGLSLAAETCTNRPDLLKTYQNSFTEAFPLLRNISTVPAQ